MIFNELFLFQGFIYLQSTLVIFVEKEMHSCTLGMLGRSNLLQLDEGHVLEISLLPIIYQKMLAHWNHCLSTNQQDRRSGGMFFCASLFFEVLFYCNCSSLGKPDLHPISRVKNS